MSLILSPENGCRLTNFNRSESRDDFSRLACAKCYELLQYVFKDFNLRSEYNMTNDGYLVSIYNETQILDLNQEKDVNIIKSNLDTLEFKKWNECCNQAKLCCSNVMSMTHSGLNQTCSAVWDGWSCHKETQAGKLSVVKCPSYIISDDCNSILDYAYFECNLEGWYRNEISNYEWANYSKCLALIIPVNFAILLNLLKKNS